MATFILKKYEEKKENPTTETPPGEEQEDQKLVITVSGTISEIVAKALNKVLSKEVSIQEINEQEETKDPVNTDSGNTVEGNVKVLSTEDINNDPLSSFRSINNGETVFIVNEGFKTKEEEWFLTNIPNKTSNVIYTLESLAKYVHQKLGVVNV